MTALLIILCFVLLLVVIVQIGKVSDLAFQMRGEEAQEAANKRIGLGFLIFMVVGLGLVLWAAYYYKNYLLGYGPHVSASEYGGALDSMFNTTTIITGIVFFVTQIALFTFSFIYSGKKGKMAKFLSHDDKLEMIWTAIPAIVMALLVIKGLDAWNSTMADVEQGEEVLEIEAMGYQFAWALRYPGEDNKLGDKKFEMITASTNPMGQDWNDVANLDDMHVDELVLPKGKKVRVRITARDVLHSFFLPHFRVKMDAVPGMPTYFVFTPTMTTEEYRASLSQYPEYQVPDPENPEKQLWQTFNYEMACAELCGNGHFSMRKVVRVVEQAEYDAWLANQKSYYFNSIRFTDEDPHVGKLFDAEIKERKKAFDAKLTEVLEATDVNAKTFVFDHVNFETASAKLTPLSKYELNNLVAAMKANAALNIALGGHTDNVGDDEMNLALSQQRADVVYKYLQSHGIAAERLSAQGFGETSPIADNDTAEGRQQNRRTEFKIVAQ